MFLAGAEPVNRGQKLTHRTHYWSNREQFSGQRLFLAGTIQGKARGPLCGDSVPKLKSRNVFVDTQYFCASNLNFSSTAFKELAELANKDRARFFLTSVTVKEVEAHIARGVKEAKTAFEAFREDGRLLRNLPELSFHSLFAGFNSEDVEKRLRDKFQSFLKGTRATILDLSGVEPETVFAKYFEKEPPFGEGKKKDEFPDAFAQTALEQWCEANGEQMYVVSADRDWREACQKSRTLISLMKLEEFISLAITDAQAKLAAQAVTLYERELSKVEQAVREEFENSGFYLEDEDGDVNEVTDTRIELREPLLLEVGEGYAIFHLSVRAEFSADVSYEDYGSGSYDHEDKKWMYVPTQEETVEEEANFEAEVLLQYDPKDPGDVDVDCTIGQDFGITVQPTDYELK